MSQPKENTLSEAEVRALKEKCREARIAILRMITDAKGSHISPALSMVELLTVLYNKIMRYDSGRPLSPDRDRFLLSKGHGSAALYVTLADRGFFDVKELATFIKAGSKLGGHPEMQKAPGIEISAGSLGHGLPIANGIALFAKRSGASFATYCLLGDGECQEGSVWEGALFAAHHKLDNLTVIVDNNGLQISGKVKDIVNLDPLAEKWNAFGWHAIEIDGHDMQQVYAAFRAPSHGKPKAILARTVKGKGVSFMEGERQWHSMLPNPEELKKAMEEVSAPIS
jgi:transketolase